MKTLRTILLILLASFILFPIVYAFSASFFQIQDFTESPARFFPSKVTFSNYIKALHDEQLPRYIFNSLLTAAVSMVIKVIITYLAAYSFAYFRFRFKGIIFTLVLATSFIPSDGLMLQNYITVARLGLLDTYTAIILPSLLSGLNILLLRQFFLTVPKAYSDIAKMDGVTDMQYSRYVLSTLASPILITIALQGFVGVFNSYLWPLLVTNRQSMRTVQIGITMLSFEGSLDFGPVFAAIMIVIIPFTVLTIVLRKQISEALTRGHIHIQ